MAVMHPQRKLIRIALPLGAALILAACGGAGPGWTYAPLGPTAPPTPAVSPTPAATPSMTLSVQTTAAAAQVFEPTTLEAPANTVIQVDYLNDSPVPHNINFFAGADATAESLGKTAVVTGPGASEPVIFTTPTAPGDYYFWCDVHGASMAGTLHVQ
jgi:plastocyanin